MYNLDSGIFDKNLAFVDKKYDLKFWETFILKIYILIWQSYGFEEINLWIEGNEINTQKRHVTLALN